MRYLELVSGIRSSALAFGCAPILGAIGGSQAESAIGTALDCGITHFDVARSYGYGEAEGLLGRALRGRRDQVVIATKFGFQATAAARMLAPLKPLVRLARGSRGSHSAAGAGGAANVQETSASLWQKRISVEARTMRRNLERSLRALRTDHVDYLFLHEPRQGELKEEILQESEQLKREGKIRAFGAAGWYGQIAATRDWWPRLDVCQFDLSPGSPHYADARAGRGDKPNVLFSTLRHRPRELSPGEVFSRLAADLPKCVIIAAMFTSAHIKANAACFAAPSPANA